VAVPDGVFAGILGNTRDNIKLSVFNEYVCVVCTVLDDSEIQLRESHRSTITEFSTIKAIIKMNPYPKAWKAAFVLLFLVSLPCPNDSHFDFMVEGAATFAVLVNAPIPRLQETFEPIIRREAIRRIDGNFRERWWDKVLAFVLTTDKDPGDLVRFMALPMYRL
jgi:hypothetical protein